YERAREMVADFVGSDLSERTLVFVRNTTEAINRCANRIPLAEGDVIITSIMEHHSNLLAWRKRSVHVFSVSVDEYGKPVQSELERLLEANKGHVRLVAISGGSNV